MDEKRMGTVQTQFAELIWKHEPVGSGELVKLCEREWGWKKPTTYIVLRKAAGQSDWEPIASGLTKTSYVDKTAQAGVTYTYTVRGVAFDGVTMGGHDAVGKTVTMPGTASGNT